MPLSSSDVEAMRVRARRRLIGMVVLVGAGVIGFPWLFETKPRPMAGDIQIVQATQPGASAAVAAVAGATIAAVTAPPAATARVAPDVAPQRAPREPRPERDERQEREEFVNDPPAPAKAVASLPKAAASKPAVPTKPAAPVKPVADKPAPKPAAKPAEKVAEKPSEKVAEKVADKSKDKPADKDKKSEKDKATARYVVQFGAFADVNTAHEARMKAERLGLKTYAQQVDTPQGKRIRVRLGPYADKAEADKAAAALRKAGLPGAVLTL